MDPIIFAQLNEAYHKGVYVQEETLSEEEYLDIQEWVEALIDEGYDLDQYSDEELYEAYLVDLDEATVLSVTSPGGKKRTLNVTKAKPARNLSGSEWKDAAKTTRDLGRQREGSSFSPQAERAAHKRGQEQVSRNRQTSKNARIRFTTSALQRRFGIPDSALDPADRSKDIPKRSVSLREELDLYDLVSEYLVSEGFCDSYEDADVIMANMSEEWRESILDEAKGTILSVKSPEGKEKPVLQRNSETSSQISTRRRSEQQVAKKRNSKNDRAFGRLSVARKKSIETMNAKPGEDEGEYDSGYYGDDDTSGGNRHYGLSRTNQAARRRRASGR